MRTFIFYIAIFSINSFLFSQTDVIQSNFSDKNYPTYNNNGNTKNDSLLLKKSILNFAIKFRNYPKLKNSINPNGDIERWNKENPAIAEELNISNYKEYLFFKSKIYPPIPQKVNTGNTKADELTNKNNLKQWMENHPMYPPYTNDMEELRKARLNFYDKYVKPNIEH